MSLSRKEIQALIQLLDDPSEEVNLAVSRNILDQGINILPDLEAAWEGSMDPVYQEKLINIIQEIQDNATSQEMMHWLQHEQADLMKGAYLVAKYQYPDLQMSELESQIGKILRDVWLELNNNLTALEKVRILNYILFEVHGFKKNTRDFYSPQNSFINQVLETRKGNPISLSIVYAEIARRLELPVFGVNLPRNFILCYQDDQVSDHVLFYINPYNKGAVLGKKEIEYFLKQQKIPVKPAYFLPCSNDAIIIRMLQNLINAYQRAGYQDKTAQFEGILAMVSDQGR